jgi:hypothetical protein
LPLNRFQSISNKQILLIIRDGLPHITTKSKISVVADSL